MFDYDDEWTNYGPSIQIKDTCQKISIVKTMKRNYGKRLFKEIETKIKENITDISSLKTINGDTQEPERDYIKMIKGIFDTMDLKYTCAGSQQSKDFRNVSRNGSTLGINIEIKKTDGVTIKLNDTLPSFDVFYIILVTGKEFKIKENILPQIIFINGYGLVDFDIYILTDYKKWIENGKNEWGRKTFSKDNHANKLKYISAYPRPNYSMNITHLLNSEQSFVLKAVEPHSQSV